MVPPNAARMLRRLGVLGAFSERAVQLDIGWEFRRWLDGTVLSAQDLTAKSARLYGEHTYTVHRADLLDAIKRAVPASAVRLGKRLDRFSVSEAGVRLGFADGERAEADVLIGADGIHSVIRAALTEPAPLTHSGMCAFRALVPAAAAPEFARRPAQAVWLGPGRHVVHYPVSGGELVNLVAIAPAGGYVTESWTATATVAEFLAEFEGWDDRLTGLIGAANTPGRWALLIRQPLPRWTRGPVTLLGDAAHPMLPFLGQGAAQAFEDAAMLASCLAGGQENPALALRRYESRASTGLAASSRAATPARTTTTCRTAHSSAPGTRRCAPPTRWRPTRGSMPTTLSPESNQMRGSAREVSCLRRAA